MQQLVEIGGSNPGETFTVLMGRWSDTEKEQWRFELGPNGPRFAPIEVPHG